MYPTINKVKTGLNLRRIIEEHGFTVKDIQQYLGLGSVQSVYHWLNGISMPTIDNLYALSELFQITIDDMVCGNRRRFVTDMETSQFIRICVYHNRINKELAA